MAVNNFFVTVFPSTRSKLSTTNGLSGMHPNNALTLTKITAVNIADSTPISAREIRSWQQEQELVKLQNQIATKFINLYNSMRNEQILVNKFKFLNNIANIALREKSNFKSVNYFVQLVEEFLKGYFKLIDNPMLLIAKELAMEILLLNVHVHNFQALKAVANSLTKYLTFNGLISHTVYDELSIPVLNGADSYDSFTKPYENFLQAIGNSKDDAKYELTLIINLMIKSRDIGEKAVFHALKLYLKFATNPNSDFKLPVMDSPIELCRKIVQEFAGGNAEFDYEDVFEVLEFLDSHQSVYPLQEGYTTKFCNQASGIFVIISNLIGSNPLVKSKVELTDEEQIALFYKLHDIAFKVANSTGDNKLVQTLSYIFESAIPLKEFIVAFITSLRKNNKLINQGYLYADNVILYNLISLILKDDMLDKEIIQMVHQLILQVKAEKYLFSFNNCIEFKINLLSLKGKFHLIDSLGLKSYFTEEIDSEALFLANETAPKLLSDNTYSSVKAKSVQLR